MIHTCDDIEWRKRPFEELNGFIEITEGRDRKPIFTGHAMVWSRRGSSRKRIVAFFDLRPVVTQDSPLAQHRPDMVRIA